MNTKNIFFIQNAKYTYKISISKKMTIEMNTSPNKLKYERRWKIRKIKHENTYINNFIGGRRCNTMIIIEEMVYKYSNYWSSLESVFPQH